MIHMEYQLSLKLIKEQFKFKMLSAANFNSLHAR